MKTSQRIIDYLTKNGHATGSELVDYLGITDRAVRKQLRTLLENGRVEKAGIPPKVFYSVSTSFDPGVDTSAVPAPTKALIEKEFLFITPTGKIRQGWSGFRQWCLDRNLKVETASDRYRDTLRKYNRYKKHGLIDGMSKMKSSFEEVALDRLFYIDFYSIEIFGKTKLGQLLLFAKQSQNRKLINELAGIIEPTIKDIVARYDIDAVGFIPPTVKRELQLMRQIQNRLHLNTRLLPITKIKTPVAVPQKTLNKIEDRITNARETMVVESHESYKNILLIDDAVGSGATLNETAKKIRQKGICQGEIIGLAITGSFKGFEVISEV